MRGDAGHQANMLLAVTPDAFIPDDHPIRRIKSIVEAVPAHLVAVAREALGVRWGGGSGGRRSAGGWQWSVRSEASASDSSEAQCIFVLGVDLENHLRTFEEERPVFSC